LLILLLSAVVPKRFRAVAQVKVAIASYLLPSIFRSDR